MAEPVFTPNDLADWLQYSVKQSSAVLSEQVAAGWLKDAMRVTELPPAPKGSALYAWALELGGIAYENPLSLTSGALGDSTSAYDRARRDRILAAAASSSGSGGAAPRGEFPPPAAYPDPADGSRHRARW